MADSARKPGTPDQEAPTGLSLAGATPRALNALLARGASILASFLLTVAVARLLGASASGTFFLVLTSLAVLATIARFGTDNLALKLSGGADGLTTQDALWLLAVACSIGLAIFLLATAAFPSMHPLFRGIELPIAVIVLSAVVPQALSVVAGAILRGSGRLALGTLAELGSMPALALLLFAAEAGFGRRDLTGALIALAIAGWATSAWAVPTALLEVRSHEPIRAPARRYPSYLRRGARQLASMMGTSLLFYVLTWAPVFVLAVTSSPSDVAFFAVAARLAAVITLIPAIQISYLAPAFSRLYHRHEITALNKLCNRSAWQALAVAAVPAAVLIAATRIVVVDLYGAAFVAAATPLVLLAIAALVTVASGQINQLMLLCDLEGTALALNLGWLVAWLTVGAASATRWGVTGASVFMLASTVPYVALAVLVLAKRRAIYSFVRAPAL